jgi:hypothetical protein
VEEAEEVGCLAGSMLEQAMFSYELIPLEIPK